MIGAEFKGPASYKAHKVPLLPLGEGGWCSLFWSKQIPTPLQSLAMTTITELWEPTAASTFILREPFNHLAGTHASYLRRGFDFLMLRKQSNDFDS